MFLDLEGDRQAENGGFDYLFGYVLREADGPRYEALWAYSPADEKAAFESSSTLRSSATAAILACTSTTTRHTRSRQ
jgi:hypothetical protein